MKLPRVVIFSLLVFAGSAAMAATTATNSSTSSTSGGNVCTQDSDCVRICGTTAPTGYVTTSFLCQSASAVGFGFNNKCVRLMAKSPVYANVPNAVYILPCPL
jgi:hypothetical protein